MDDRFRVGAGCELVSARNQAGCEAGEIVDLTVEDNYDRSIFVKDRLLTSAEVDDTQAEMP